MRWHQSTDDPWGLYSVVAFFTSFVLSTSTVCLPVFAAFVPSHRWQHSGITCTNRHVLVTSTWTGKMRCTARRLGCVIKGERGQPELGITGTSPPAHRCSNPALPINVSAINRHLWPFRSMAKHPADPEGSSRLQDYASQHHGIAQDAGSSSVGHVQSPCHERARCMSSKNGQASMGMGCCGGRKGPTAMRADMLELHAPWRCPYLHA